MNFYIKFFYDLNEVWRGQQTYILKQESRKCVILKCRRSGQSAKFTLGDLERIESAKWKLGEVESRRSSSVPSTWQVAVKKFRNLHASDDGIMKVNWLALIRWQ